MGLWCRLFKLTHDPNSNQMKSCVIAWSRGRGYSNFVMQPGGRNVEYVAYNDLYACILGNYAVPRDTPLNYIKVD